MRPTDFEHANTLPITTLEAALRLAERRLRALTKEGHNAGIPRKGVTSAQWYEAYNAVSDAQNTLEAAWWLVRKRRRTVDGGRRAG